MKYALMLFLLSGSAWADGIEYGGPHIPVKGQPFTNCISFYGDNREKVGDLCWKSDSLVFEGNAEESARVFFEGRLRDLADEYFEKELRAMHPEAYRRGWDNGVDASAKIMEACGTMECNFLAEDIRKLKQP